MSIAKTRLLRLALCFSLLGCFIIMNPLAAYDCGCVGYPDYECQCGPDCACEADEDADEECETEEECDEECDEEDEDSVRDPCYGGCMPCECMIDGYGVSIDYLYWNPCVTGLHYAVKRKDLDPATDYRKYDYHYVGASSASGFRVGLNSQFTIEGLSFKAIYTDVGFHDKACVISAVDEYIRLSHGSPHRLSAVNRATGWYDMKYQTVEAVFVYELDLEILKLKPYGGVDVLLYDNRLTAEGSNDINQDPYTVGFRKQQQYFGAGPMLGFGTSFGFTECLSVFFDVNASLFIGGAEEDDRFYDRFDEDDWYFKSRDCYCFPGWHIMLGLGYESELCGLDVGFRIGYEFVQYTNAPWFLDYEEDDDGLISSVNANNLSFRGLFAGVSVGF
ncbi:MAG: Lpg1974 family pore-forming outer membrane protein [Chlamydiota bacterium]